PISLSILLNATAFCKRYFIKCIKIKWIIVVCPVIADLWLELTFFKTLKLSVISHPGLKNDRFDLLIYLRTPIFYQWWHR
ncbi:hypothetical protein, partial [Enterobacter hormaechei]|uniref:hypothetical protein n=1 Tax=Enterobacter hormaechei TaxID=158836 RepID=UPI003315549E